MVERRQRTCKCGHTRSHEHVAEEPEYTLWGWLVLSLAGITLKPDHIVYRCQLCRQTLGTTRDPKILARRMKRGKDAAPPNAPPPADAPEVKGEP